MNAVLSEKGQVTIPKKLRDNLGLVPGSVLDFLESDGKIIVQRVVAENPISSWKGRCRLPAGSSVDHYLRIIRDGQ
jgi:antitoxin PrlF